MTDGPGLVKPRSGFDVTDMLADRAGIQRRICGNVTSAPRPGCAFATWRPLAAGADARRPTLEAACPDLGADLGAA